MNDLKLFVRLAKVDEAQRIVYGTAIDETPDRVKEVFDYATSKPMFEEWSAGFEKVTDGKSFGNVRSMHGTTAAGKLTQITFDDDGKKIDVAAKIVDENEWNKVVEGVYTGFSIGGKYVKKWKDGESQRYTARPSEVSLVDLPCVPTATFAVIKSDGSSLTKLFKSGAEQIEAKARDLCRASGAEVDADAVVKDANGEHPKWHQFMKAATDELAKAEAPATTETPAPTPALEIAVQPSNDAVIAKATELAKAAGTGKSWMEFVQVAHAELAKAAPSAAPAAEPAASGNGAEDGDFEQVWMHKRLPGKTFKRKADMTKALVDQDAADAVAKATAPVRDQLKAITDSLAKRDAPAVDPVVKPAEAPAVIAARTPEQLAEMVKKGEAMPDGSLPIATKDDIVKAIEACGARRAGQRFIRKRAKALGATDVLPATWSITTDLLAKIETPELKKAATLSSVSNLLYILSSLETAEEALESSIVVNGYIGPYYYTSEGTRIEVPKTITDRFGTLVVECGDCIAELLDAVLAAMRTEEADEATKMAGPVLDLMKVGARHSKADQQLVQKIHDHAEGLGAACAAGKAAPADDLAKRFDAERDAFTKAIGDISGQLGDVVKRLKSIEDQPMPVGHSTARVVEKKDDARSSVDLEQTADKLLQNPDVLKSLGDAAIRAAHRAPMSVIGR